MWGGGECRAPRAPCPHQTCPSVAQGHTPQYFQPRLRLLDFFDEQVEFLMALDRLAIGAVVEQVPRRGAVTRRGRRGGGGHSEPFGGMVCDVERPHRGRRWSGRR